MLLGWARRGPGLQQELQVHTQLQKKSKPTNSLRQSLQCFIRVGGPLFPFHPCKRESDRWPNALSVAFRPLTDDIQTDDLQTDNDRPATTNSQPLPRRPRADIRRVRLQCQSYNLTKHTGRQTKSNQLGLIAQYQLSTQQNWNLCQPLTLLDPPELSTMSHDKFQQS